ncbi:MAG: ring-opening amidohydrolase [Bacteriovorax sp.]|nr:ring-opening amidohydrolase [Rhizobacter sp.]
MPTAAHQERFSLRVDRLPMDNPGDLSGLAALLREGIVQADNVVAVIGKTEGNGGVNDFTRGYFTQSLMQLLAQSTGRTPADLIRSVPCVLSGGTEGVLSPHYVVFSRSRSNELPLPGGGLAIGTAIGKPLPAHEIGRWTHVRSVADTVQRAMAAAQLEKAADVTFVQVKSPCVTSARAQAASRAGHTVLTADPGRSMAYARAAGAFGVAVALGELPDDQDLHRALLADFSITCHRASISSGIEVEADEVILLGHSRAWGGNLRMGCAPMADALDISAVDAALLQVGLRAAPQLSAADRGRLAAVFVKCEPDRRGTVRGARHTMLDDIDINPQRHIRCAVGGLVAGVLGDTRLFVSGGAEHQGPDGGGLIAVIAQAAP